MSNFMSNRNYQI